MNADAIATLVLYAIQALQAGIAREAIIDDVRLMESQGATPKQISEHLATLADHALAEINAVQPPPGVN
jgi:hypothetical protein